MDVSQGASPIEPSMANDDGQLFGTSSVWLQIAGDIKRSRVDRKCPSEYGGASSGRGWLAPEDAGGVAVQLGEEVLDAR